MITVKNIADAIYTAKNFHPRAVFLPADVLSKQQNISLETAEQLLGVYNETIAMCSAEELKSERCANNRLINNALVSYTDANGLTVSGVARVDDNELVYVYDESGNKLFNIDRFCVQDITANRCLTRDQFCITSNDHARVTVTLPAHV